MHSSGSVPIDRIAGELVQSRWYRHSDCSLDGYNRRFCVSSLSTRSILVPGLDAVCSSWCFPTYRSSHDSILHPKHLTMAFLLLLLLLLVVVIMLSLPKARCDVDFAPISHQRPERILHKDESVQCRPSRIQRIPGQHLPCPVRPPTDRPELCS